MKFALLVVRRLNFGDVRGQHLVFAAKMFTRRVFALRTGNVGNKRLEMPHFGVIVQDVRTKFEDMISECYLACTGEYTKELRQGSHLDRRLVIYLNCSGGGEAYECCS